MTDIEPEAISDLERDAGAPAGGFPPVVYEPESPEALRESAAADEAEAAASFERCDTDGFLSQWASGMTARLKRLEADIRERGGVAEFPALFRDGALVPAVIIETKYGAKWGVFASAADANGRGRVVEWVPVGPKAYAKRGYTIGLVERPAKASVLGSGRGLSGAASAYVGPVPTDGLRFNPAARVTRVDRYGPGGDLARYA